VEGEEKNLPLHFYPSMKYLIVALITATWALLSPSLDGDNRPMALHAPGPDLSVDTDSSNNTASSVGTIELCRSVASGASSFTIDVVIQNVSSLAGIEADLFYNQSVLTVTAKQTNFLLTPGPPPGQIDFSDPLPDSDGNYHILLATTGNGSGSGVIIRLTVQPGGDGVSPLDLANVKLRDFNNDPVQPSDALGFFTGDIQDGVITVGSGTCSDYDSDGIPNESDPDDDNDKVTDSDEANCGSNSRDASRRPERIDGPFAGVDDDGDTLIDEPLPSGAASYDCDGDGYKGSAEDHVFSYLPQTNGDQKTCQEYDTSFPNSTHKPSKRWPADLNGSAFSLNKINISDLAAFINPIRYLNQDVGTDPNDVRFDLVPGSTVGTDINVADMAALTTGVSGFPPMLSGSRAFNGPVCPYGS
jgi:hypothetical protein